MAGVTVHQPGLEATVTASLWLSFKTIHLGPLGSFGNTCSRFWKHWGYLGGVLPWRKKLVFLYFFDFYGSSWGQEGFENDREP